MRIVMPFAYGRVCKVVGGRKPVEIATAELVEFDVPEVSEAAAPVVASWTVSTANPLGELRSHEVVCRMFDGQFHIPAGYDGRLPIPASGLFVPGGTLGKEYFDLLALLRMSYGSPAHEACFSLVNEGWPKSRSREYEVREVLSDDRERQLAMLNGVLESMLLIEGNLWRRVDEPKLRFTKYSSEQAVGKMTVHVGGDHMEPRGDRMKPMASEVLFPLDGRAALVEYASSIGLDVREDVSVSIAPGVGLRFETGAWLAERAAISIVEDATSVAGGFSAIALTAWLDLRDIVEGLTDGTNADEKRVLDSVSVLVSELGETALPVRRAVARLAQRERLAPAPVGCLGGPMP